MWNPQNPSVGDKVARAIVYFVALIYMFLGMSIIADRFMSSIEVGNITPTHLPQHESVPLCISTQYYMTLQQINKVIVFRQNPFLSFLLFTPLLLSFPFMFHSFIFFFFQVITSQEKEITIKKPNGETTTATVRIWNETVSNLTLMALGSSAPEILLSVIEVGTI